MLERSWQETRAIPTTGQPTSQKLWRAKLPCEVKRGKADKTHHKLALSFHSQSLRVPLASLLDMTSHPSRLLGRDGFEECSRFGVLFQLIDQIVYTVRWTVFR